MRIDRDVTQLSRSRSQDRYRRIGVTALANAGARFLSLATTLISVPFVLHSLGVEQFGLWVAVTSLVMILGFTDLGLSNGLVSAIAEANGRDDNLLARKYVSNALALLFGVAALATVGFFLTSHFVSWGQLFNVSTDHAARSSTKAVTVISLCVIVGIPLGVIQRIQLGYQEAYVSTAWFAVGSILTLLGIMAASWMNASLPWFVFATVGLPLWAAFLNGVMLFGRRRPWLRPRFADLSRRICFGLLKTGAAFFILQAAAAIAYQSDALIVSHILGVSAVADYSVPARLFFVIQVGIAVVMGPLWPAYGESIARGDIAWVEQALRRSLALTIAVALPCAAILVPLSSPLLRLWVGDAVHPSLSLLLGLASWTLIASFSTALAMFLNGANLIGLQATLAALMAIANLLLSIVLTRRLGVSGVVWGSVLAQFAFILLPLGLLASRLLVRLRTRGFVPATVLEA